MAINPETLFPGKIEPSGPGYPYGSARNIVVPGDGTGTPWDQALLNDMWGFYQTILDRSGVVPNGAPDSTDNPQYFEALVQIAGNTQGANLGKNKLINGGFQVNQRTQVSGTPIIAGEYGHDRWRAGAGGVTYTFATVNNVTTATITAGTLEQEIEGNNLVDGDYTLSWGGTAQGQIDGGGFADSPITVALTGGTNAIVEFDTGTLELVQLEQGVNATEFEHLLFSEVRELCRWYFRDMGQMGLTAACRSPAPTTDSIRANTWIPRMRAGTSIVDAPATIGVWAGGGTITQLDITSMSASNGLLSVLIDGITATILQAQFEASAANFSTPIFLSSEL